MEPPPGEGAKEKTMSHGKDFVPKTDAGFDAWMRNLVDYTVEHTTGTPPAWDHIPPARVTALVTVYRTWHAAYEKTLVPHTPADTSLKNETFTAADKAARVFVKQYLLFPPVTDQDRINTGVPNHKSTHTPIPPPATRPQFRLVVKDTRLIAVNFRDAGSG